MQQLTDLAVEKMAHKVVAEEVIQLIDNTVEKEEDDRNRKLHGNTTEKKNVQIETVERTCYSIYP